MNTKVKQLILIILLLSFLAFIFLFFTKNSFTNITGGAIANANAVNPDLVLFRINPPYPAAAYLWDDTLGTSVVYNNYSTPGPNPHACTGNNLIGYINTSFVATGGHFFYPEATTANTATLASVCYDNFECLACSGLTNGCDTYYTQGYNCYFSIGAQNGGRVGPCTGTGQQLYNVVCREQASVTSCGHIVVGNTVGTDAILFRVAFPPNTTTSPAPPNAWNSWFSVAVTNDGDVGPNPHACLANNANRIGRVDGNFFYSINSTSLPLTNVPTPVCYSNFICQPCTHANGGCNVYYAAGYLPYFSISSLASSKIQDCDILSYNYVCKEQIISS